MYRKEFLQVLKNGIKIKEREDNVPLCIKVQLHVDTLCIQNLFLYFPKFIPKNFLYFPKFIPLFYSYIFLIENINKIPN